MDASGAFWYVVAGAMVAVGAALVYWFRRSVRWLGRTLKTEYLSWFQEAVEEHVAPMLEAVKDNSAQKAVEIQQAAEYTADSVRKDLQRHTAEEGEIVRVIVKEEIAPLVEQLTDVQSTVTAHLDQDERRFDRAHEDLVTGQGELVQELQSIRSAIEKES